MAAATSSPMPEHSLNRSGSRIFDPSPWPGNLVSAAIKGGNDALVATMRPSVRGRASHLCFCLSPNFLEPDGWT